MSEAKAKKIEEIFLDEVFVNSLQKLERMEDVRAELKKKGLEMTLDEIRNIWYLLSSGGEMSDKDLENVTGGVMRLPINVEDLLWLRDHVRQRGGLVSTLAGEKRFM